MSETKTIQAPSPAALFAYVMLAKTLTPAEIAKLAAQVTAERRAKEGAGL